MTVHDTQLKERIDKGFLVESVEQMTDDYKAQLRRILTVSADTELVSAPAYFLAAQRAPSINSYISALGIIQDELGHAHIAYRLMRDLGVDTEEFIYDRKPNEFKYPYAFDVPLETWAELVVANGFYDRAGFVLLSDVFRHTSFGPWKRALVKVDKEETFHLRHGEHWMSRMVQQEDTKAELQRAVDWMFPLTVEWFGLPDELKHNTGQLAYGLKGSSNDQLRQQWMATAVPLCEKLGLSVPAHLNSETGQYDLDFPFPARFDAERKEWDMSGTVTWDDVLKRWRARGPMNEEFVTQIQRGNKELRRKLAQVA